MKEVDLSKTGYFDYLIKDGSINDPGRFNGKIKFSGKVCMSNQGGLDYGPVPEFNGEVETKSMDFTPEVVERMREAFVYEYFKGKQT